MRAATPIPQSAPGTEVGATSDRTRPAYTDLPEESRASITDVGTSANLDFVPTRSWTFAPCLDRPIPSSTR